MGHVSKRRHGPVFVHNSPSSIHADATTPTPHLHARVPSGDMAAIVLRASTV